MQVTSSLEEAGFEAQGATLGEKQHRWKERDGHGLIDVLIPENLGRAADYCGAGGFPGLATPGAQFFSIVRRRSSSPSGPPLARSLARWTA